MNNRRLGFAIDRYNVFQHIDWKLSDAINQQTGFFITQVCS
ncbi:MAG: hypothetical protein V3U88_12365 [Methylococcales bacterium]